MPETKSKKTQSDKAKREKIKADKKAATLRKAKGAVVSALKTLTPIAKDINARMSKAAKMEDDAYDHRLAASLRLAEANAICKDTKGITFKAWCAENVDQRYDTCSRLASIGRSDNPQLALTDQREKNKLANAALRERVAAKKASPSKTETTTPSKPAAPVVSTQQRIEDFFDKLDKMYAPKLIESIADKHGLAVMTKDVAKAAKSAVREQAVGKVVRAQKLVNSMTGAEKMSVLSWLAGEVGVDLPEFEEAPRGNGADDDLLEVPEFLKRPAPKKSTSSRRKAA